MATLEEIEREMRAAKDAGDLETARHWAREYVSMRDAQKVAANAPPAKLPLGSREAAAANRQAFGYGAMRPIDALAQLTTRGLERGARGIEGILPSFKPAADWMQGERENVERINGERRGVGERAVAQAPAGEASKFIGSMATSLPILGRMPSRALGSATLGGMRAGAVGSMMEPGGEGQNFWTEKALQAGAGGLTGGLVGAAVAKLGSMMAPKATAPTSEALKEVGRAAYKTAKDQDVIIDTPAMQRLAKNVQKALTDFGVAKGVQPKTIAAYENLAEAARKPNTLQGLELLRRVALNAGKSQDPSDREAAKVIRDQIDEFLETLKPGDFLVGGGGPANTAIQALQSARAAWAPARKVEMAEDLIDRAKIRASSFSGSGFENALRHEFKTLALNPRKMRFLSKEEREAVEKVAKGTPLGNVLRWIGKFSPNGVISTVLSAGAGHVAGGPMGAAAMLGAGMAGRSGATAITERNARNALEVLSGMRQKAPPNPLEALLPSVPYGSGLLSAEQLPELEAGLLNRR